MYEFCYPVNTAVSLHSLGTSKIVHCCGGFLDQKKKTKKEFYLIFKMTSLASQFWYLASTWNCKVYLHYRFCEETFEHQP